MKEGCSGNVELTHLLSITDNETRKDFMNTDEVQRRLLKCSGSQRSCIKTKSKSEGLPTENKAISIESGNMVWRDYAKCTDNIVKYECVLID